MPFHFTHFSILQNDKVFKLTTDSLVLAGLTELNGEEKVLDVGTGTGVIALLLKDRFPGITVDAIDINPDAVELAKENFQSFPNPSGIDVFHGSIDSIPPKSYDLIISNPPYFKDSLASPKEWKTQARHTTNWDWTTFFEEAHKRLSSNGRIALILPFSSHEDITLLASHHGLHLHHLTTVSDQATTSPKLAYLVFGKASLPLTKGDLALKNEEGSFSEEYKGVLMGWVVW
jgi:tRNA1Val (adenine37-N6)-methyltransferase